MGLVGLTLHKLSGGRLSFRTSGLAWGPPLHSYVCVFVCVMGCTCQRGVSGVRVIQEAIKMMKRKTVFLICGSAAPFHPQALAPVHLQHIKRGLIYWIQELWIRPVFFFLTR